MRYAIDASSWYLANESAMNIFTIFNARARIVVILVVGRPIIWSYICIHEYFHVVKLAIRFLVQMLAIFSFSANLFFA